ncbi:hypothetical protein FD755_005286 [Muntiacus reevesi]|uniref:Nucleoside diphosphate kinase, mitochondrial n=1 Tax=Muntiacus reevesi TaxID=9886 RepID=A0A5J5MTB0_MUNRE|nr:hypothetical protein FD755_005286 [Muntiacus reevesi]
MRCLSGLAALRGLLCGARALGPSLLARSCSGGPSWTRERTLVAVKPDGVQRRLVGDVIQRFERRGFKLVGMKMLQAPERILAEHYHDLQRKPFYPALISYMSSGPVVAMVWEGPNVVCTSRAMIGHTNSTSAPTSAGMSSMPATPWRGPRERSSCGSRAVSWWTGQMKATSAASTQPEHAGARGHPGIHSGPATSVDKNLISHPCSAHLSQTTSLSTFCPTPATEWLSHQLYVPFSIILN